MTHAPAGGLDAALARAQAGDPGPLYAVLARGSRLPGPSPNLELGWSFAATCASVGPPAAGVVSTMARLDADFAPGGTELEFLPLAAVLAAGECAARVPSLRPAMVALLHDAAEDKRFRVRDAVPLALMRAGAAMGPALAADLEGWTDGYFHAAAALRALTHPEWLSTLPDAAPAVSLLSGAFALADGAPRAAERYPGYKALLDALAAAPEPLALRFGAPVFDALAAMTGTTDPKLRALLARILSSKRLVQRHHDEVRRVQARLAATEKPVRDPRSLPRATRKRGGGRRR